MNDLSHTSSDGKAKMVDVSGKLTNLRTSEASGTVFLNKDALNAVVNNEIIKGDVLSVAKIAGIQGAKKTSELIPLCHNIFISSIDIDFVINKKDSSITIKSKAVTESQTGIEMEAMTAVSIAALTIYDMCKAVDKSIRISDIVLQTKTGGKSGDYIRSGE